nr:MAG TPA: hypothetical protein [Caudoviricetes sp.]
MSSRIAWFKLKTHINFKYYHVLRIVFRTFAVRKIL